jgi:hypothetical protein
MKQIIHSNKYDVLVLDKINGTKNKQKQRTQRTKWPKKRYKICYLLTPWCRVLPEQLPGLQLVKKFPAFHGTQMFITALTSVRHLSQTRFVTKLFKNTI